MATITFPSRTRQSIRLFDGLLDGIIAFVEGVRDGLDMEHTYRVLSRMSPDELRRRGLTRGEISGAVAEGRVRL
jgi:hypothetical protein